MRSIVFGMFFSILLVGCTNKKEKKEYFENGNVKTLIEYMSSEDTLNYKKTWYDEQGCIRRISYYKNRKEDGLTLAFYPDGKLYGVTPLRNGHLYGVSILYNSKGQLWEKNLFINDTVVYRRNYKRNIINSDLFIDTYEKTDNEVTLIGELRQDSLGNHLETRSDCYCILNPKDTLEINKPYTYKLKVYFMGAPLKINSLTIGEMLSGIKWKDRSKNIVYRQDKESSVINYTITPTQKGYFFFTGELDVTNLATGETYQLQVFENYWVK